MIRSFENAKKNLKEKDPGVKRTKVVFGSTKRLEMIEESTGLAWWDQYFATGKVLRSKNWASMLGYTQEEIENDINGWVELIHPRDREWVKEAIKMHEDGITPTFEVEHRLRTKNGQWKWILNWGKVVERDDNGQPVRAVGTHLDITIRKEMEIEKALLIQKLEYALKEIKIMRGIIPICSNCKKIRDDHGSWIILESYIQERSEAEFSHGMCPECIKTCYPELASKIKLEKI